MKLYLLVDMEGIMGFVDYINVLWQKENYERSCKIMMDEVNVVIYVGFREQCLEVVVNDSYLSMNNFFVEWFYSEIQFILGSVKLYLMVQGLDQIFDGVMFLGYYVKVCMFGVMFYLMIFGVCNMYIDDMNIGELGFNVYVVGYYGVLVLMVVGDD